ncbi:MAG: hypothetical protein R2932_28615 [Caldilineaceae bacterium]
MEAMCETWQSCLVDRWWIILLTVLASGIGIAVADYLGINRPLPFSVALGGILSFMVMEAYPYAWTLGNAAQIILWIVLSGMAHALPQLVNGKDNSAHGSIWEHFEEVNSIHDKPDQMHNGASARSRTSDDSHSESAVQ